MLVNLADIIKSPYELSKARELEIARMRGIIASWNKSQLQKYVYNQNKRYPISEAGLSAVIERFINTNEFRIGTMSEELKSGFDIVRSISKNYKINFQTTDLIYEFIKYFKEVILYYDRQSSQTYYHKLMRNYRQSIELVNKKLEIEEEMRVKY